MTTMSAMTCASLALLARPGHGTQRCNKLQHIDKSSAPMLRLTDHDGVALDTAGGAQLDRGCVHTGVVRG